jgi:hypothetical protein
VDLVEDDEALQRPDEAVWIDRSGAVHGGLVERDDPTAATFGHPLAESRLAGLPRPDDQDDGSVVERRLDARHEVAVEQGRPRWVTIWFISHHLMVSFTPRDWGS